MRFAIATTDRYLGVFGAFLRAGWKPYKLFTMPLHDNLADNRAVMAIAEQHGMSIQLSRLNEHDLADLQSCGCEALIVASYPWKVPDWQPYLKYAVNFHCSPLPVGRGPYPVIRAILEKRDRWGVTCHRLTQEMDSGAVLAAETFPMQLDECHESLDLKIQMASTRLAARVVNSFENLWNNARPQEKSAHWKMGGMKERVFSFHWPVDTILRHVRAYGAAESIAAVNSEWLLVTRAVGWTEDHTFVPGQLVHMFQKSKVVAALDGFIAILESTPAPPLTVEDVERELQTAKVL